MVRRGHTFNRSSSFVALSFLRPVTLQYHYSDADFKPSPNAHHGSIAGRRNGAIYKSIPSSSTRSGHPFWKNNKASGWPRANIIACKADRGVDRIQERTVRFLLFVIRKLERIFDRG